MSKVLVTGAAGFIGSNLVKGLIQEGYDVIGIDNFSYGCSDNIEDLDFEFVNGDILDDDDLSYALYGVDYVLHHAAIASVQKSIEDPKLVNDVNLGGTINVLQLSKEYKVKRVIFASSAAVYGDAKKMPLSEDSRGTLLSPYAVSKAASEDYCRMFMKYYGLETISLRYFNVFGPNQDIESEYSAVIPSFINRILSGERPIIYGDGKQTRDFVYVGDIIKANIAAMHASKEACGRAYNIACKTRTTLNDLAEIINKKLGTNLEPIYESERPGDIKHSMAYIYDAWAVLGYNNSFSLEQGIEHTIEYYKSLRERY